MLRKNNSKYKFANTFSLFDSDLTRLEHFGKKPSTLTFCHPQVTKCLKYEEPPCSGSSGGGATVCGGRACAPREEQFGAETRDYFFGARPPADSFFRRGRTRLVCAAITTANILVRFARGHPSPTGDSS